MMACIKLRPIPWFCASGSLSLYTRLGFATREPLSIMQGPSLALHFPGYDVRPATPSDISVYGTLCRDVHGFERSNKLSDAIRDRVGGGRRPS